MNVLLLSIGNITDIEQHEIYSDLLRAFRDNGHNVYAVGTNEKRLNKKTEFKEEYGIKVLRVKTGNITKCGFIEKGISTITLEFEFKKAIKKYLSDVKFDLVLYSTPPITFCNVVRYLRMRDGAYTYLMLKDIFPRNALDTGVLSRHGIKGLIYRYFKFKEKKLYEISDTIGCMSQANIDYVIKHNPSINPDKVRLCPNCIEVQNYIIDAEGVADIRKKYGIPTDKRVYVYGGNLGKPQDIPFIIECLKTQINNKDSHFLIVGDGTEYDTLRDFLDRTECNNISLKKKMPKDDFDKMIAACDIGLIFLDYRFTIPNYPSRLLAYMQVGLPVIACTDEVTDIGKTITDGEFGWWCPSNSPEKFAEIIRQTRNQPLEQMKINSLKVLKEQFDVSTAYNLIMSSLK